MRIKGWVVFGSHVSNTFTKEWFDFLAVTIIFFCGPTAQFVSPLVNGDSRAALIALPFFLMAAIEFAGDCKAAME